jgi:hypothetical protein
VENYLERLSFAGSGNPRDYLVGVLLELGANVGLPNGVEVDAEALPPGEFHGRDEVRVAGHQHDRTAEGDPPEAIGVFGHLLYAELPCCRRGLIDRDAPDLSSTI